MPESNEPKSYRERFERAATTEDKIFEGLLLATNGRLPIDKRAELTDILRSSLPENTLKRIIYILKETRDDTDTVLKK
jgi:hypothetical protein